jgi:hypothetical protein
VTLRDLPATLQELAGAPAGGLPGLSLSAHWRATGEAPEPPAAHVLSGLTLAEHVPERFSHSLVIDGHHFVRRHDGKDELYDWRNDPWETEDLAGSQASAARLEAFRSTLTAALDGGAPSNG